MTKIETNKRPAFLEYVRELNGDVELSKALMSSLTAIDNLDIVQFKRIGLNAYEKGKWSIPFSYTNLQAHETAAHIVCRLMLQKKKHIS